MYTLIKAKGAESPTKRWDFTLLNVQVILKSTGSLVVK